MKETNFHVKKNSYMANQAGNTHFPPAILYPQNSIQRMKIMPHVETEKTTR